MSKFEYKLIKNDGKARAGVITTPHGKIETPVFMPVGTHATVKTVSPEEVKNVGSQIILSNAYHLYLRPGLDIIENAGGIHKFMNWNGPILTDSGGFQVFSLGTGKKDSKKLVKITEAGVEFSSHLDGSKHFFSPESAINMQEKIGADIIMAFDECAPHNSSHKYAEEAMIRTHNWAEKCLLEHKKHNSLSIYGDYQALFGITQGVVFDDLRIESAKYISSLDFDGVAIGGLSVGETKKEMYHILEIIEGYLPKNKPRYLMGVGAPDDLLESIERGVDMFDCVLATRIARNGTVWTSSGKINLNNSGCKNVFSPLDESCDCYTCKNYSTSYVAHLIREKEVFGLRLTTIHNLRFLHKLIEQARAAIKENRFNNFKEDFMLKYKS